MGTLTTIGNALYTVINRVDDLRVHRYPPNQLAEFPCGFLYPENGRMEITGQNEARNFHTWNFDLLSERISIEDSAEEIEPYMDSIQAAIWADIATPSTSTIMAVVDHVGSNEDITYRFLSYELAGKLLFGYQMKIPVKVHRIFS